MARETGIVSKFFEDKGYGFITREGKEDIFVGKNAISAAKLGTLHSGDQVSFTVKAGTKGSEADNLQLEKKSDKSFHQPKYSSTPNIPQTKFRFDSNYLKDGYFDNGGYVRPEILDTLARDVAIALGTASPKMKSHQLRRFFNKVRGIEARLLREKDFKAVEADILSLNGNVVYQTGRKVVPDIFKVFIETNVALAIKDEKNFKQGFLQHFQCVLAYFVFYFRDNDSGK